MKNSNTQNEQLEWEMRPGGMLVQRRDDESDHHHHQDVAAASHCPMIEINVAHGPAQGKEREDSEHLHTCGVKDKSKILLLEELPNKEEKKPEEIEDSEEMRKALQSVVGIRAEIDKLSERVTALEVAVNSGTKVAAEEFDMSAELLMKELLKLDSIEAEGEARMQRKAEIWDLFQLLKFEIGGGGCDYDREIYSTAATFDGVEGSLAVANIVLLLSSDGTFSFIAISLKPGGVGVMILSLVSVIIYIMPKSKSFLQPVSVFVTLYNLTCVVCRVQKFHETLDCLKAKNSNPFSNSSNPNAVTVTTQWETFDSGVGSLNPPPPKPSSTTINQDWEQFD
ncbi:hypothetical protein Pint_34912 [Pistacia integerrima]|uniref:Uncharacterized protein n=1 Tax=Pistacia integerrima TaxID=434235 RepID=A0ACC0Y056_9ROSI|nr:hypothetical protein Pint_34912 [Pistacia integerrima]